MNQSDIEFTMGLDTSPAEQKLNQFQSKMKMADAAFDRAVSRNNASFNVIRNSPNYQGFGFEKFNSYDNPLMNAAKKFETVITSASEKLRLQNERTSARREYTSAYKNNDLAGMQTASQKFEKAQFGLDQMAAKEKEERTKQREITDETKAQNREHNESYIKLSKIHKLLLTILAAWQAIKKVAGAAFGRQGELMKETGFLTMDPTGAFQANAERSYAMVMAGLSNMKGAAPFSMGAFDEALTKIQTAKERAMAGQGVDDNLAISVQQLNDTLGTNFNAVQLLTGDPNRSNTEILTEILDSIEKQLPKLADMDEQTRSRTMHYIRSLIGPELANALMANLNLNLRTGDNATTMERVFGHGGNVVSNINVAEATRKITDAGAELAEAVKKLSDKFLTIVDGPLTALFNDIKSTAETLGAMIEHPEIYFPNATKAGKKLQEAVDKFDEKVTSSGEKVLSLGMSGGPFGTAFAMLNPAVMYTVWAKTGKKPAFTSAGELYKDAIMPDYKDVEDFFSKNTTSSIDMKANLLRGKSSSVTDLLNAQIMLDPAYRTAAGGELLEQYKRSMVIYKLYRAMQSQDIESLRGSNFFKYGIKLKGYKGDKNNLEEFTEWLEKNFGKTLDKDFSEGKVWDINSDLYGNPMDFILGGLSDKERKEAESIMALRLLQPSTTGGSVESGWRETKDEKMEFVVRLLTADGKEYTTLRAEKQGTEYVSIPMLQ